MSVRKNREIVTPRALLTTVGDGAVTVPISEIRPGASPREKVCTAHVRLLAAVGESLPPVLVHRETMQIVDGVHRLRAAEMRGSTTIRVRYFDGSVDDAYVAAIEANSASGLPLSMAERRAAASRIIATHGDRSDRWIARVSGLSAGVVAEIRNCSSDGSERSNRRVGRDGRVRPLDTGEGRLLASRLMREDPGRSLRDIARAAGIAPSTALDVRNRLNVGLDPVPARRTRRPAPVASSGGRTRRRKPPAARPEVDPPSILDELRRDPSLRFSEAGRALLRWLDVHTVRPDLVARLVQGIPAHCTGPIASLADHNARFWAELSSKMAELERTFPAADDTPSVADDGSA